MEIGSVTLLVQYNNIVANNLSSENGGSHNSLPQLRTEVSFAGGLMLWWMDRQIEDTWLVVVSLLIGPRSTDSIKLQDNKVFSYHHELIIVVCFLYSLNNSLPITQFGLRITAVEEEDEEPPRYIGSLKLVLVWIKLIIIMITFLVLINNLCKHYHRLMFCRTQANEQNCFCALSSSLLLHSQSQRIQCKFHVL